MRTSIAYAVALGAVVVYAQQKGVQSPAVPPFPNGPTSHGCYKSSGELKKIEPALGSLLSSGSCNGWCKSNETMPVAATNGVDCLCGSKYPPKSALVDDKNCNYPCPAYPLEACGGLDSPGFFSVYNTGVELVVPDLPDPQSTSVGSPTGGSSPSQTATVTSKPDDNKPSSGSNTAGIAAGVVVGVIAVAAIAGGIWFYLRRKRNREIEEEHRRNAAVNSFIGGAKPPSSSGGLSMTDSRMDPSLAQRRMSSGSIADNQDYSRKILRVTNA